MVHIIIQSIVIQLIIVTPRKTSSVETACLNFISYSGTSRGSKSSAAVGAAATSEECQMLSPSPFKTACGPLCSGIPVFDGPISPGPMDHLIFH